MVDLYDDDSRSVTAAIGLDLVVLQDNDNRSPVTSAGAGVNVNFVESEQADDDVLLDNEAIRSKDFDLNSIGWLVEGVGAAASS
jgi:hypothetical protein